MSLIQEALRRQQEEMQGNQDPVAPPPVQQPLPIKSQPKIIRRAPQEQKGEAPPPTPSAPETPPPMPQQDVAAGPDELPPPIPAQAMAPVQPPIETDKPGARSWIMFTGIGIAAVLALGVGIWAFMFAFKPSSKTETVPGTTAQQKQPDANAAKTQDGPATTAAVKPAGPVLPAVTPPTTPVVSQPDTATPAVQPPEQAQPTVQPQPVLQPPPPKEPVVWPALIVNGVVGRGKQGSVKINNEILGVGDTVGDVRIMSIEVQGVLLGYKGETKLLRVGGSTQ